MRWIGALAGGVTVLGLVLVAVVVMVLGLSRSVEGSSSEPRPRSDDVSATRVEYDPVRLTAGLGAAAVLLATAGWLVRTTDWSAVGEASAPEIDDAEYADLDALALAFEGSEFASAVTRQGDGDRLS